MNNSKNYTVSIHYCSTIFIMENEIEILAAFYMKRHTVEFVLINQGC